MHRRIFQLPSAMVLLAVFICSCGRQTSLNPLERALTNRLGSAQLVLGATFADWTNVLSTPSVVEQNDGGHTFFYWPNSGVGVFCHPLYHGQHDRANQSDWTVTSVLIPLKTEIHPRPPPVQPESTIRFTELLFRPDEVAARGWIALDDVKAFEADGILESLLLDKPDSVLGDYN
jgi:hypothetical protein